MTYASKHAKLTFYLHADQKAVTFELFHEYSGVDLPSSHPIFLSLFHEKVHFEQIQWARRIQVADSNLSTLFCFAKQSMSNQLYTI